MLPLGADKHLDEPGPAVTQSPTINLSEVVGHGNQLGAPRPWAFTSGSDARVALRASQALRHCLRSLVSRMLMFVLPLLMEEPLSALLRAKMSDFMSTGCKVASDVASVFPSLSALEAACGSLGSSGSFCAKTPVALLSLWGC